MTPFEQFQSEFIKVLPAALLGIIPLLWENLSDRLEKRNRDGQKRETIDFNHRRVTFINDFIKAHETCGTETLATIKQNASQELTLIKQELDAMMNAPETRTSKKALGRQVELLNRGLIQRVFLAYFPVGMSAQIFHALYYMLLSVTFFVLISLTLDSISSSDSIGYFIGYYGAAVLAMVVFLGPPLFFIRWLAVRANRNAQRRRAKATS